MRYRSTAVLYGMCFTNFYVSARHPGLVGWIIAFVVFYAAGTAVSMVVEKLTGQRAPIENSGDIWRRRMEWFCSSSVAIHVTVYCVLSALILSYLGSDFAQNWQIWGCFLAFWVMRILAHLMLRRQARPVRHHH